MASIQKSMQNAEKIKKQDEHTDFTWKIVDRKNCVQGRDILKIGYVSLLPNMHAKSAKHAKSVEGSATTDPNSFSKISFHKHYTRQFKK